jgi:uncharacterized membrane-anchored protein YitT (DUF2179 family)
MNMNFKTIKILFIIGIILFAIGIILILVFNNIYAVGIMGLGVMWMFIGYKQLKDFKKNNFCPIE